MPPSHVDKNIFETVKKILQGLSVQNHIIAITTDSTDPNRIACELLENYLKVLAIETAQAKPP